MNKPVYVTVGPEHVGKTCLKAFGEVILAERFSGELVPRGFSPADIGRRIYLVPPYQISIEPAEQQRWREAFFAINYVCQLLGWTVWAPRSDGPFALGDPWLRSVTPWCESLRHLDDYCEENADYFRSQVVVN